MRWIVILALAGGLAACVQPGTATPGGDDGAVPTPTDYQAITFAGETATASERAVCEAAGGEVRQDGLAGWERCIQTPPDAGKSCTDSSECLDRCKIVGEYVDYGSPATGQCSQSDSPFGCFQTVENGLAEPALCVD